MKSPDYIGSEISGHIIITGVAFANKCSGILYHLVKENNKYIIVLSTNTSHRMCMSSSLYKSLHNCISLLPFYISPELRQELDDSEVLNFIQIMS